jgi:fatty-acyl-CoA synthase
LSSGWSGRRNFRITGRLKEILCRSGEKISPRGVDEILMDQPAVAQIAFFGVPQHKLGEAVADDVDSREGQGATTGRSGRLRNRDWAEAS